MAEFNEVKDSGKRQNFDTGSVRDTDEGKGQPHLIAGEALCKALNFHITSAELTDLKIIEENLLSYSKLVEDREKNIYYIYSSIELISKYISSTEDNTHSSVMKRLAKHYQNGAKKYSKNNWRKGQPISRYYDSSMRHLWALMDDKTEEDHAAALLWNLIAIIQTKIDVQKGLLSTELNDYPFTIEEVFMKKEK